MIVIAAFAFSHPFYSDCIDSVLAVNNNLPDSFLAYLMPFNHDLSNYLHHTHLYEDKQLGM